MSSTKRDDDRLWSSCGCHDSHVTCGHGRSAGGNGGYGQPVATAGPRAHDRTEGQAAPPARRRRPRRRNERIPGPGRYRLRLCRPRHPPASAALPRATTAAPQAATTATVASSKRQLAVAESFQRTTRRRADDPGATTRPLSDSPPLIPTTKPTTQNPSLHLSLHPLRRSDHTDRRHHRPTRRSSALTSPERTRKCTTTDRTPQRRRRTQ